MNSDQKDDWQLKTAALLVGKPLQQILGFAYFRNLKFEVNEHTLIPRPETEELVGWVVSDWKDKGPVTILDVGTGSGCMAISLSLELPQAKVMAIDISEEALAVARRNNEALGASVDFHQMDFLRKKHELPYFDVVVSNPPYIPISEKGKLDKNVRDYEPEMALFVPDGNPTLFYDHLAAFGRQSPSRPVIYCEIHQDFACETEQMFWCAGYSIQLLKDLSGNDRMMKLTVSSQDTMLDDDDNY